MTEQKKLGPPPHPMPGYVCVLPILAPDEQPAGEAQFDDFTPVIFTSMGPFLVMTPRGTLAARVDEQDVPEDCLAAYVIEAGPTPPAIEGAVALEKTCKVFYPRQVDSLEIEGYTFFPMKYIIAYHPPFTDQ